MFDTKKNCLVLRDDSAIKNTLGCKKSSRIWSFKKLKTRQQQQKNYY